MYDDRVSAGKLLAERLVDQGIRPDTAFAIPPGGVNVARPLYNRFDADLGLIVAELVRAPSTNSHPVGAVTDTGTSWINDDRIAAFDVDRTRLEAKQKEAFRDAREKHDVYEDIGSDPTSEGTVVLVSEAITAETRLKACVSALDQGAGCYIVAAAPVGFSDAVAGVETIADEVVVTETVTETRLHRAFYDRFGSPIVPGAQQGE
jgi:predicted phosphoribosyltransferase